MEFEIRKEFKKHNDIIQEDFIDSYNNLTIKSVLMLKWVHRNCLNQAAFLMKSDDDTFVHIPNVLHYLLGGTLPIYEKVKQFYNFLEANPISYKNRLNITKKLLMGFAFCSVPARSGRDLWYIYIII